MTTKQNTPAKPTPMAVLTWGYAHIMLPLEDAMTAFNALRAGREVSHSYGEGYKLSGDKLDVSLKHVTPDEVLKMYAVSELDK